MQNLYQGSHLTNMDSSSLSTRSGISIGGRREIKPHAIVVNSDIQDNYSAYRVNSNIKVSPIVAKQNSLDRRGFLGDKQAFNLPQEIQSFQLSPITPNFRHPLINIQRTSSISSQWSRQPMMRQENQLYHQRNNIQMNNPYKSRIVGNHFSVYRKLSDSPTQMSLPTIYNRRAGTLPSIENQISQTRYLTEESTLARVEKLIMNQSQHLEKLITSLDLSNYETKRSDNSPIQQSKNLDLKLGLRADRLSTEISENSPINQKKSNLSLLEVQSFTNGYLRNDSLLEENPSINLDESEVQWVNNSLSPNSRYNTENIKGKDLEMSPLLLKSSIMNQNFSGNQEKDGISPAQEVNKLSKRTKRNEAQETDRSHSLQFEPLNDKPRERELSRRNKGPTIFQVIDTFYTNSQNLRNSDRRDSNASRDNLNAKNIMNKPVDIVEPNKEQSHLVQTSSRKILRKLVRSIKDLPSPKRPSIQAISSDDFNKTQKILTLGPMNDIQEETTPIPSLILDQSEKNQLIEKPQQIKKRARVVIIDLKPKARLRQMLWAIAYPFLMRHLVEEEIKIRRRNFKQNTSKEVANQKKYVLEFIQKHCIVALKSLYKESKSMIITNEQKDDDKEIPKKELQKRFPLIISKLTLIMESLNKAITRENLPEPFLNFFADISFDGAILPNKFLTEFELSCLEFSHYGTLKNMSPIRSKAIIGMFFLLKVLLVVYLNQPWSVLNDVKDSSSLILKLRNVSSVMYNIVMEYFKDNELRTIKDNQQFIHPSKKIQAVKFPPSAFDTEELQRPSPESLMKEVITGLYSRKLMNDCFTMHEEAVNKLKSLVGECLEKLFSIISKMHQDKIKRPVEEFS